MIQPFSHFFNFMYSWIGFNFGKTNRGIVRWLAHNSSNPICSKCSLTYQDRLFCTNQTFLPIIAAHLTLLYKRFPVRMNTFLFSSFANRVTKLVSRTTRYISEAIVITIQVAGDLSILRLLVFSFIHPAPSCFLFYPSCAFLFSLLSILRLLVFSFIHPAPSRFLFYPSCAFSFSLCGQCAENRCGTSQALLLRGSRSLSVCVRYYLLHSCIFLSLYHKYIWKPFVLHVCCTVRVVLSSASVSRKFYSSTLPRCNMSKDIIQCITQTETSVQQCSKPAIFSRYLTRAFRSNAAYWRVCVQGNAAL